MVVLDVTVVSFLNYGHMKSVGSVFGVGIGSKERVSRGKELCLALHL